MIYINTDKRQYQIHNLPKKISEETGEKTAKQQMEVCATFWDHTPSISKTKQRCIHVPITISSLNKHTKPYRTNRI
ncbi:hypothetical protein HanHA89_Chr08g0289841 [Helianthus annuus]|nr:hypothetical protein HanHA89_Chr08g0289841 [Helianthus annuus]